MSLGALSLTLPTGPKPAEHAAFLHCLYDITHGHADRLVYVEQVTTALKLHEGEAESVIEALVDQELVRLRLQCILSITQAGIDEVKSALPRHEAMPEAMPSEVPVVAPAAEPALRASLSHTLLGAEAFAGDLPDLPPDPAPPALAGQECDDLELKLICEAIGLDPKELDSRPSPPAAIPDPPSNGHHPAASAPPAKRALPHETGSIAKTLTALMLQLPKLRLTHDDLAEAEAEIATATAQLLSPRPKQPIIAASLTTLLAILDAAGPAVPIDLHVSLTEIRLFLTHLQA